MSDDDWTTGIDALVISECRRCTHRWYLPRDRCPNCGTTRAPSIAQRRHRHRSSGHRHARPFRRRPALDVPFGICLVDLDDGVRVMGRAALTTQVGDRVHVTWERHQPVFVSADPFLE